MVVRWLAFRLLFCGWLFCGVLSCTIIRRSLFVVCCSSCVVVRWCSLLFGVVVRGLSFVVCWLFTGSFARVRCWLCAVVCGSLLCCCFCLCHGSSCVVVCCCVLLFVDCLLSVCQYIVAAGSLVVVCCLSFAVCRCMCLFVVWRMLFDV